MKAVLCCRGKKKATAAAGDYKFVAKYCIAGDEIINENYTCSLLIEL